MLPIALFLLSAQAADATPVLAPPLPAQKMICRKSLETGSLVRKRKVCRTQQQWEDTALTGRSIGEGMREFRGAGDGIPR